MTALQRFDPRLHLAAAIGWSVFVLVTLAALAAEAAERRARDDAARLLAQFATQIRHALGMNLQTRRLIVQATAAQIVASNDRGSDALRRHLEAVQAQFPEFAWLGVVDERGRVVAASGGGLQGEDVVAGLLAAGAAVLVTRMLTRRLVALAGAAQAVQRGTQRTLAVPAGRDEVSRIGASLAELVGHLQQEKQALLTLNAELDARVAERTARIERLADGARHAAVTRERLRLARDLHDTLAHSLMALLTQIRLVRKLRGRLDMNELGTELGRAEEVAVSGLAEARAAITQMRHGGVRDVGLGAALQELLVRFGERTGVAASLQADPQASGLADERAETVFRIVEEALHNVERHARAQAVSVSIAVQHDGTTDMGMLGRVRVEISDDGTGFDPALPRPGHYGLRGIQEQAALVQARFVLNSQPGAGTRISLEFDA